MRSGSKLQILAVSVYGDGHEDIAHLQWQSARSSGVTSPQALIAWLGEGRENEAWLADGEQRIAVEVAAPDDGPPHLRSRVGGEWGEHLLGLPRF